MADRPTPTPPGPPPSNPSDETSPDPATDSLHELLARPESRDDPIEFRREVAHVMRFHEANRVVNVPAFA